MLDLTKLTGYALLVKFSKAFVLFHKLAIRDTSVVTIVDKGCRRARRELVKFLHFASKVF